MEVLIWIFAILGIALTIGVVWTIVLMTIDYFN